MSFPSSASDSAAPPRIGLGFPVLLLAGYVALFELWIRIPRLGVLATTAAAGVVLFLALRSRRRAGAFLDPLDFGVHLAIAADLVFEGLFVRFHEGHGHWLCAAAFGLVVLSYRLWRRRRIACFLARLGSPTAGVDAETGAGSGMDDSKDWEARFREVYRRGAQAWASGRRTPGTMFTLADVEFLASVGCSAQELFDFVDDALVYGDPDLETVLEIQRIRRDHFLKVLGGRPASRRVSMSSLPAKTDAVDGIAWLPRLIVKARLKLRGEMPDDLMYGCAGDRPFLRRMNSSLPEFLQWVADAGDDDRAVIEKLKAKARG